MAVSEHVLRAVVAHARHDEEGHANDDQEKARDAQRQQVAQMVASEAALRGVGDEPVPVHV